MSFDTSISTCLSFRFLISSSSSFWDLWAASSADISPSSSMIVTLMTDGSWGVMCDVTVTLNPWLLSSSPSRHHRSLRHSSRQPTRHIQTSPGLNTLRATDCRERQHFSKSVPIMCLEISEILTLPHFMNLLEISIISISRKINPMIFFTQPLEQVILFQPILRRSLFFF